jgi:hypothetical protein
MSVHCGGIVVVPDRIDRYVPVENAPKGVPIIQWEKDQAEDAGLDRRPGKERNEPAGGNPVPLRPCLCGIR